MTTSVLNVSMHRRSPMSKRFWAIILVVTAGLIVATGMVAKEHVSQVPRNNVPVPVPVPLTVPEPPFKGKVIVFALKKDAQKTALQDPSIKRLGEINFLTGQVAGNTEDRDWRMGTVVWVPLANVREIVEFKDLRDAKRALTLKP
jgi:hypothetical protein